MHRRSVILGSDSEPVSYPVLKPGRMVEIIAWQTADGKLHSVQIDLCIHYDHANVRSPSHGPS